MMIVRVLKFIKNKIFSRLYKTYSRRHLKPALTDFIKKNVTPTDKILLVGAKGDVEKQVRQQIPDSCILTTLDINENLKPDIHADITTYDAYDNYDLIICLEILEHVYEGPKALDNLMLFNARKTIISSPFLFPIHLEPYDYYRYTEHFYRRKLKKRLLTIDHRGGALYTLILILMRLHAEKSVHKKLFGYFIIIMCFGFSYLPIDRSNKQGSKITSGLIVVFER